MKIHSKKSQHLLLKFAMFPLKWVALNDPWSIKDPNIPKTIRPWKKSQPGSARNELVMCVYPSQFVLRLGHTPKV